MTPREGLTPKEIQITILVWEGMTNREMVALSARVSKSSRTIYAASSTNLASGAVWNSPCMWPLMAVKPGLMPSTKAAHNWPSGLISAVVCS